MRYCVMNAAKTWCRILETETSLEARTIVASVTPGSTISDFMAIPVRYMSEKEKDLMRRCVQ